MIAFGDVQDLTTPGVPLGCGAPDFSAAYEHCTLSV